MSQAHQYTLAEIQAMLAIPNNPVDQDTWHQAVLQLLQGIVAASGGGGGGEQTVKIDQTGSNNGVQIVGGVQRTLTSTVASTGATVAAGAKSVSFTFSSDYAGSVNGAVITPSVTGSKSFNAPGPDTLPAIVYTCTAGTVTVDVMT